MSGASVGVDAVERALDIVEWPPIGSSVGDVTAIEDGVNDAFVFSTGLDEPERAVCKFATFSEPIAFQAGVTAYRLLARFTAAPVPEVYAVRADPPELPAFQITEFLPGETLPGHPDPETSGPARALGEVIVELGAVPSGVTDGYGWIQPDGVERTADATGRGTLARGEYDTCSEWFLQYGLKLYGALPAHDALAASAGAVPSFLREHSDRFPVEPPRSILVTDFGPGNLLARGGRVSSDAPLRELTGLIDLERAKLGPMEFNAVNAEFLMTRGIDDPGPIVDALYDPLPFGPEFPGRDLYRLLAIGREVGALDLWYEVGSETHDRRGNELVSEIERIVN